jgi:hypothetical protein
MAINTGDPRVCPYCAGVDQHKPGCKMLQKAFRKVDLFHWTSVFMMPRPGAEDIEVERRQIRELYKVNVDVFEIQAVTFSGVRASRVVWKRVSSV